MDSWGILRRTALRTRNQAHIPRLSSVAWCTSTPAMSILETGFFADRCRDKSCAGVSRDDSAGVSRDDCAGVSRNDSRVRDSRNESRADDVSRNEPSMYVDSRNGLFVEVDFQRDDETFLDVRKDDVTCVDFQTDGVTLPVSCSSSSSSLGPVVVGPHENVCSDMKLESHGVTDDSTSGPLAKSADMKRLVEIAVANGSPIRVTSKDVRKRMQIEARRQKERQFSQPGESRAATAFWTAEERVDSFRQSCQTLSCDGQEVARDPVLVDCQRQGVFPSPPPGQCVTGVSNA